MIATFPDLLAVGLAAFVAGMIYGNRQQLARIREMVRANALVVDSRAYILAAIEPAPGKTTTTTITWSKPAPPTPKAGELVVLPGGKPEEAA